MSDDDGSKVSDVLTRAIEKPENVERLASGFLGPVAQGWHYLSDRVRLWRSKSVALTEIDYTAQIFLHAQRVRRELGIDNRQPVALQSRVALRYAEAMEGEDDPSLQELWANLLVNTTRADGNRVEARRSFGDALREMEADDALLLNVFARRPEISQFWHFGTNYADAPTGTPLVHYDLRPTKQRIDDSEDRVVRFDEADRGIFVSGWTSERVLEAIDRLRRLSLIEYAFNVEDRIAEIVNAADEPGVRRQITSKGTVALKRPMAAISAAIFPAIKYRVSALGRQFYNAVRSPEPGL